MEQPMKTSQKRDQAEKVFAAVEQWGTFVIALILPFFLSFFSFWLTCVRLLVPLQMLCWSSLHKIRVWFPRNLRNVDSQNSIKSWDILCQHLLSDFHSCVEETVYICSETYAKIILYSLSSGHPLLYATENIREQPHCTVYFSSPSSFFLLLSCIFTIPSLPSQFFCRNFSCMLAHRWHIRPPQVGTLTPQIQPAVAAQFPTS